jgi:hypothetical protein
MAVIVFVVLAVGAYLLGVYIIPPKRPLQLVYWTFVSIAALLVLLHAFGIGPGVRVH